MSEALPVRLPSSIADETEILLRQWLVEAGDEVHAGERIAEVSVPGALVVVVSPCDGRVESLCGSPRSTLSFGQPVAWIRPDGDNDEKTSPK